MTDNKQELIIKIKSFINQKKEGKTWDFKEKWYTSKAYLLHDILNMANNELYEDSYIIIGVNEQDNFSLNDISEDENRYNQNKMNNFLRSAKIKFSAGNIPVVKLETIKLDECVLDIIIIKSTDNVPYYLIEDYEEKSTFPGKKDKVIVRSSNIYIRRNDSNTPINKNAEENEIERLWRKRIGIDLSVNEKFIKTLSKREDWECYDEIYFHKFIPDFTFNILPENYNNEFYNLSYAYEQCDSRQHTYKLECFFRNLKISEFIVDSLDGGRMTFVRPNFGYIDVYTSEGKEIFSYLYFIKNDIRNKINNIFVDITNSENNSILNIIKKYVIYFDNEVEKKYFEYYLNKHINELYDEAKKNYSNYKYIEVDNNLNKEKIIEEICLQAIITKKYIEFKHKKM